jgi:hypothetical protein
MYIDTIDNTNDANVIGYVSDVLSTIRLKHISTIGLSLLIISMDFIKDSSVLLILHRSIGLAPGW